MKLGVALVSLLSVVLTSPVPVSEGVLRARGGGDSSTIGVPVKTLVDDINKSIGTQLNARQVQELALIVDYTLGLGENANGAASGALPSKPNLSPAEILANARKALSAAENTYMKYPNKITEAAYLNALNAIETLW
ncbi:hypothetical protein VC83_02850 [Pseudogymnoascus destructans]|uniref:Secreted protein n=1 Tax=Pseudogymnoascus destructans TaxID=655981 RepID=A0A177AE66_9PEZI|nr:uncharacterized protein VC83_02850 [Pseudogymnoascus destructans]OAF60100.1 hypothetical protein VC83_02850 [Pseudogymnoascus destructans]